MVMRAVCPRCGREARAPTAWSSAWRCDLHGEIYPLAPARLPTIDQVSHWDIAVVGIPFDGGTTFTITFDTDRGGERER